MHRNDPSEIVASLREGLLVLTEDLDVEYASDRFLRTFGVSREETVGRRLPDLGNGQWNIPDLLEPLGRIVTDGVTIEGHNVDHTFERIGRRVMRLNARRTVRSSDGSTRILLAIDDVTDSADAARELERQRLVAQGIVDSLREPLLVLDGDLKVVEASRAFFEKFKVTAEQTIGRRLWELGNNQWAIPELIDLLTNVIPAQSSVDDFEVTHEFPEIGRPPRPPGSTWSSASSPRSPETASAAASSRASTN